MLWSRLLKFWQRWRFGADTGSRGEALAAAYLVRHCGCRVVARNWRNPADRREEIDLVMEQGEVLVFVEVKARSARALVSGYHAVTTRKKKVLRRACRAYLFRLKPRPHTFRFDIVEVEFAASGSRAAPIVRHYANVPLFRKDFRF